MFAKKYEFSTNMKIDEIVKKLENITIGKHLYMKKVQPNYIGKFDNTGFRFRNRFNTIGNYFLSAKYIEQDSTTYVSASIKTSPGTFFFYLIIDAVILLSLFSGHITLNLIKLATISLLLCIPVLIVYLSFKHDKRQAEIFLKNLFDLNEPFPNKEKS